MNEKEDTHPKKKILVISNYMWTVFNFRRDLITHLRQENCSIIVLSQFDGYETEISTIATKVIDLKINRNKINPFYDLFTFFQIFYVILSQKPDVVLSFTIKPVLIAGFVCRLLKVRHIPMITGLGKAFLSSRNTEKIALWLYRICIRKSQKVIFHNKDDLQKFRQQKIVTAENSAVTFGSGINLQNYCYSENQLGSRFKFLFLGRLLPEKGIKELLYATQELARQRPKTPFELVIVGPILESMKKTSEWPVLEPLLFEEPVIYQGFQQDTKSYIEAANCIILPSYREGFSRTLIEGCSIGRPLIATDTPGCREAIIDGQNGYLVAKADPQDLFNKMRRMLDIEKEEYAEMCQSSRGLAETYFDINKILRLYSNAIHSCSEVRR